MKIKPGQYYSIRSGLKAYVACRMPLNAPRFNGFFVGLVYEGEVWKPYFWAIDGQTTNDNFSIVADWVEPPPLDIMIAGTLYRRLGNKRPIGNARHRDYIYINKYDSYYVVMEYACERNS